MTNRKHTTIEELIGETLIKIEGKVGSEEMIFTTADNRVFRLYHIQDCCEHVYVEDICGIVQDLIGSPIVQAQESSNRDNPPEHSDSITWTFYRLATAQGSVVIRWLGKSNGYYSESVDFCEII